MRTNLRECWLCCSHKIHAIDYKVPLIVSAAFLEFEGKGKKKAFFERLLESSKHPPVF